MCLGEMFSQTCWVPMHIGHEVLPSLLRLISNYHLYLWRASDLAPAPFPMIHFIFGKLQNKEEEQRKAIHFSSQVFLHFNMCSCTHSSGYMWGTSSSNPKFMRLWGRIERLADQRSEDVEFGPILSPRSLLVWDKWDYASEDYKVWLKHKAW